MECQMLQPTVHFLLDLQGATQANYTVWAPANHNRTTSAGDSGRLHAGRQRMDPDPSLELPEAPMFPSNIYAHNPDLGYATCIWQ